MSTRGRRGRNWTASTSTAMTSTATSGNMTIGRSAIIGSTSLTRSGLTGSTTGMIVLQRPPASLWARPLHLRGLRALRGIRRLRCAGMNVLQRPPPSIGAPHLHILGVRALRRLSRILVRADGSIAQQPPDPSAPVGADLSQLLEGEHCPLGASILIFLSCAGVVLADFRTVRSDDLYENTCAA